MRNRAFLLLLVLVVLGSPILFAQIGPEAPVVVLPSRGGGGGGGGGGGVVVGRGEMARGRSVPIGAAVIAGRVTEARTGLPVSNVRVTLSGIADALGPQRANVPPGVTPGRSLSRTTATDDDGRFVFEAVPSGEFSMMAMRGGFLAMAYGAKRPDRPGTPIRVDGSQRIDVDIAMMRGGAIAGVIVDARGEPLAQAQVRALRVSMDSGVRRVQQVGGAVTDDRGAYRMYNLVPGEYLLTATPAANDITAAERARADGAAFDEALDRARRGTGPLPPAVQVTAPVSRPPMQPPGFVATYYPGTPAVSSATTLTVEPDSERLGVDFSVAWVRASHVAGTVTGMPETSVRVIRDGGVTREWRMNVQVVAYPEDPASEPGNTFGSSVGPSGEFMLYNLPPGRYSLVAQTRIVVVQASSSEPSTMVPQTVPDVPVLWGRTTVDVDGQSIPQVAIALQPARTISGRVEYDIASGARPQVRVTVRRPPTEPPGLGGQTPLAAVEPDGRFTITNVVPGRYLLGATLFVKSAIVNGQDSLDVPFEVPADGDITNAVVTVTDRVSELSGTVVWPAAASASGYTVVIAPVDRQYWTAGSRRIQSVRPSSAGRYVFRGLPAGSYLLAAVTDLEPGRLYDPAFLKALAGAAVPVTITDGGRQTQDIRLGR